MAVPHTSYTVDVTGRLTGVVDAAGRMMRSRTYKANFDTATATTGACSTAGTTTNTYGANSGESLTKSQSPTGAAAQLAYNNTAAATKYLPSGNGRPEAQGVPGIEQIKYTAGTAAPVSAYIERDPVTGAPLLLRTSSGMQSMYVYDGTGNPITLITSAGYQAYASKFDPSGTAVVTTDSGGNGLGQNPFTFKGGIQDRVTGWVHFGQRLYDPATGRFTQQDTLDAPLSAGNANRYAYAADDPINNLDPLGEGILDVIRGCAIGISGALSGPAEAAIVLGPEAPGLVVTTACVAGGLTEDAAIG